MISLKRTNAADPAFQSLVRLLDEDLADRDGEDHGFYARFNTISTIRHAIVAFSDDEQPVSCGAIKEFEVGVMEVKRMYTLPMMRGQGLAGRVLQELETWAREMHYRKCVLETGKRQPEAIRLYQKCGYTIIPNYGQYAGIDNSVCFEKKLT